MRYRLAYDYHTHTVFSHGTGSIEENVRAAAEKGLRELAIADHGIGSLHIGVKKKDLPKMRAEIERLKPLYPQLRIHMCMEANITFPDGWLDIPPELRRNFDFLLAGYHFSAPGPSPFRACAAHLRNYLGSDSKRLMLRNTEMILAAVRRGGFRVLTHPGDKAKVDLLPIARACAEQGILMEINNKHDGLSVEGIRVCAAVPEVLFIMSSDAHSPERVGCCENAVARMEAAGLDPGRVVNLIREEA